MDCECDLRVWFDTGFWYNEGNRYILEFGGEEEGMIDVGCVKWLSRDEVRLEEHGIAVRTLPTYPHSLQGTETLYTFLKHTNYSEKQIFGILVWHQLAYQQPLMACWESGRCGSPRCYHKNT